MPSLFSRFRQLPLATRAGVLLLVLLALLPVLARNDPFIITLFTRILIFAFASLSLNLILGYGGMVSFGHALFLGLGVYSAGILSHHGIDNGWLHLAATVASCLVIGLVTGCIVLRTTGIAFIMITLAFAQMLYFLFVSLSQYGGDDGMRLSSGSDFGILLLNDGITLYLVTLALLCAALFGTYVLIHARLGMVLRASKSNEKRMRALGFPTFRYRLAVYALSAVLCGIAGLLYANLTQFASPSYMSWMTSGDLIVMVMLGGLGTLFGPVFGSLAMILTEEGLKMLTDHWMAIFGPLVVAVAIASRLGVAGLLNSFEQRRGRRAAKAEASLANQEPRS